jgi:uncharacterized SAM-binding protein YcdF (DUF218 family)
VPWGRGPRYRVEGALFGISWVAARLGLLRLTPWLARPLFVAEDVRPQPFIVVLCGGCRFSGRLSESTCARVEHGVRLFEQGLAPRLILSGGRWAPHRPACAPRMQALALALGVPPEAMIVENRSASTAENAREVARLLRAEAAPSILLVTGPLHMRRAKLCFEKLGVHVACAPTPATGHRSSLLVKEVLHEYLGLAYYRAHRWI